MAETGIRIAMWSGPRNISTALMRAFENRPDTVVTDEPLYGHYLLETGVDHPGREEVIASQETDWRRVVAGLAGEIPGGRRVWYQKHMTHHLLPAIGRDWLSGLVNAFLIRDPREVLTSYVRTRSEPTLGDIGIVEQAELFSWITARTGRAPPVIDARDVLERPEPTLRRLCEATGVAFSERMLAWPAGPRESDGVWGRHWYGRVWRTTGFLPYRPMTASLPERLEALVEEAMPHYQRLRAHRIVA
jgi:hypothetical protein